MVNNKEMIKEDLKMTIDRFYKEHKLPTMNISDEMALTGNIWIPSFEEQQKIADYMKALDSQITLQTLRLDKLKQIKSACLDNMFV